MRRAGSILLIAAGLLAACGETTPAKAPGIRDNQIIGLSSSLPIYWPETAEVGDLLSDDAPQHWARGVLEESGKLVPVDALDGQDGALPLPLDALLVLAQPFPFSPSENVALDNWVRAGGHVLLFADPMLTAHSAYALGDRRRPQDIALLSPILTRWGLELRYDEEQPEAQRELSAFGVKVPVHRHGTFAARETMQPCDIEEGALAANCSVGKGRVFAIADAALFETHGDDAARERALRKLVSLAGTRD